MSFLAPLYLLGLATVTLPILLHLIRRTPRGRMAFSSLMFLTPSPPRLTRRSRLDQILLLLLRVAALILLGLAFARPFFREAANLTFDSAPGRRIAIVLDTSASMRRGNLWPDALSEIRQTLRGLEDRDDVALITFHDQVETRVDFETREAFNGRERADLVRQQLTALEPGWGSTELGAALLTAADALTVANDLRQSEAALQILLVSDFQQGARLDALQSYEWPQSVFVDVRPLATRSRGNAALRIVTSDEETPEFVRVRLSNNADSTRDQFYLHWDGGESGRESDPQAVYLPAGQSTILQVPRPDPSRTFDRLVLKGDDESFDNQFFTVPLERQKLHVGYLGEDTAEDPEGLRYYLELAFSDTYEREIVVIPLANDQPLNQFSSQHPGVSALDVVVVARAISPELLGDLQAYLRDGGCILTVLQERASAVQLVNFVDAQVDESRAGGGGDDYVMLGEIDFGHPLFSVFAKPQYNDFTKIHFWNHVPVQLEEVPGRRVLARFDDGSPAFWEQRLGDGRLYVLTSGWRPSDSQLALSTKFVPLLIGILNQATRPPTLHADHVVHEAIHLPPRESPAVITKPDGQQVTLAGEVEYFQDVDQPGLYQLAIGEAKHSFAANLTARESETSTMEVERLEQLGVRVGAQPTRGEEIERERQLRDIELEGRQRIWQWLLASVLAVLCLETWLAGRRARE